MSGPERSPIERAALATKHGKEELFGPPFAAIGWATVIAPVDTDEFGTFAGEVERRGSPLAVVERKARAGAIAAGLPFGLASEGSFGRDPSVPFALVDEELVAWVDTSSDLVVVERATAISTVPPAVHVTRPDEVANLRVVSMFPHQAAIVVVEHEGHRHVVAKGITALPELTSAVEDGSALTDGRVLVEPDLRAHLCPDRRAVISEAVDRLATRVDRRCPACDARGFGRVRTRPGLPCSLCELPTTRAAVDIHGCRRCGHELAIDRPGLADPTHCDRCNP